MHYAAKIFFANIFITVFSTDEEKIKKRELKLKEREKIKREKEIEKIHKIDEQRAKAVERKYENIKDDDGQVRVDLTSASEKQERKEKKILTDNRMVTVNKRETSFEGLVSQFENGEDGIYNLVTEDKNQIFQHKVEITEKDLEEILNFNPQR